MCPRHHKSPACLDIAAAGTQPPTSYMWAQMLCNKKNQPHKLPAFFDAVVSENRSKQFAIMPFDLQHTAYTVSCISQTRNTQHTLSHAFLQPEKHSIHYLMHLCMYNCRPHQRQPAKLAISSPAACSKNCFKTCISADAGLAMASATADLLPPQASGETIFPQTDTCLHGCCA